VRIFEKLKSLKPLLVVMRKSENIVGKLMGISNSFYALVPPMTRIVTGELAEIRDEIRKLPYEEFLEVLTCAKYFTLPPDFKNDLEAEYFVRSRN
jgi:hypothetical protein